ncbi:hypothetical protein Q3A66_06395 [Hymenobacter sp. BT770]|uniref:hypothetical protein n=1 Tax=Hymenobacter sp. BT770 TaxID=2886942 RepID=UPI001D102613|nr:hypothetical protein [Hymenobacter sp. BT770]MCC3152619.1 hypothetical protein [Hymenobacter sp. BT770]MDO3414692.1 hypothetical protein [Hymenobacter sp. BT770]
MKKLILGFLLVSTLGSLSSCKESSKIPAPSVTSVPLIFPKVSADVEKSYFNTTRAAASIANLARLPDPTRPVFEFSFDIQDQRDVKIQAVEVYKSFQRGINIGPRVLQGTYSSFPAKVSINSQEALTGLQRLFFATGEALPSLRNLLGATPTSPNEVLTGDLIVFTFEYVLEDGSRVILTPLSDVKLTGGATAKVISGTQINPPYALYAKFTVL